jgi:hypothetical protein
MSSADCLRRAAELPADGDWQGAHAIVQDDPSPLAARMHGIVHLFEGDASNALYWYGKHDARFLLRARCAKGLRRRALPSIPFGDRG